MALSPNSSQLTQWNFADGIRSAFYGPYVTDSPEYRTATTFAAQPPIYDRTLIRFHFKRATGPSFFIVGSPVAVTYEPLYVEHRGRALYGLVRQIDDTLDTVHWSETICQMTVEVHCIPNFRINWESAIPWVIPPPGAIFIQPHGFTSDEYRPRALYAAPLHDIICLPLRLLPWPDFYDFQHRLWNAPLQDRLPPPHEYTQHPAEDDDHTIPWTPPAMPVIYVQPHGFLSPEFAPSPETASSSLPSSDEDLDHHVGIVETTSSTVREMSEEGSASNEERELVGESALAAIYQLEVDIAGEELDVDEAPSVSPSSTPDSMPELRLINDVVSPWVSAISSTAPPVSPALFSLVTTARPAADVDPPAYADLPPLLSAQPPMLQSIRYVPPPPLHYEPLPEYRATTSVIATPTLPPSLLGLTIVDPHASNPS